MVSDSDAQFVVGNALNNADANRPVTNSRCRYWYITTNNSG
jgi:hypothetical protein